jgi:hypothetical protein
LWSREVCLSRSDLGFSGIIFSSGLFAFLFGALLNAQLQLIARETVIINAVKGKVPPLPSFKKQMKNVLKSLPKWRNCSSAILLEFFGR